jgi:hypothetical protein
VEPEPTYWPKLGLNDLSVLMPLPASPETPWTLAPNSTGLKGELLPIATFDEIPGFPVIPADALDYWRMRVVSIRFVGCEPKPQGCQAQIRLIMQPINDDGSARDSALHLFYDIDDDEMAEVVRTLRWLRTQAPEVADSPLDVHAGLAAQGFDGAYGQGLVGLILTHAGEENLTRMTFFLRAPPAVEVWFFGGFDFLDGNVETMNIVGVGQGNQRVILQPNASVTDPAYEYEVNPPGLMPEDGHVLYTSLSAETATDEERRAAFASYLRVENPTLYNPEQLPCAGCHLSTFVTADARRRFGFADEDFASDVYQNADLDLSLRGDAANQPSSLRAFGYFKRDVMISQRVINSTADVLADIETRWPAEERPPETVDE